MDQGQRIYEVELVDAQNDFIGENDASPRRYIHKNVEDSPRPIA